MTHLEGDLERSDQDGGGGEFVLGFIFGGLVGAVLALLFAPQSGEETRAQIKEAGIELQDRAMEFSDEMRKKAEEFSAETQRQAEQLSQDLSKETEEWSNKLDKHLARGKRAASEQVRNQKSTIDDTTADA